MTVKGNAKFEEELSCTFKNDMRNLANFYRLENIDFILESKMKLNQNETRSSRCSERTLFYLENK